MLLELTLSLIAWWPQLSISHDVEEAQRLQAQGKLVEARSAFEACLRDVPAEPAARDGLSMVTERLALEERGAGHADVALATLLRGVSDLPDDQRLLYDLGVLEDEMQLDLDAASTLEHLLRLKPADPNAYYAMSRVDLTLGRLGEAETAMKTYLDIRPEDASAHYGLGRVYLQGLRFDAARQEFARSIELQPKQSEAYYELGETNLYQEQWPEAISCFSKTLERNPKHGGALVGMGTAYFKQKRYQEAEPWLRRAIEAAADYQPGHYYLGLTLARLGKQEESRHELEVATALAAEESKRAAQQSRIYGQETKP